MAVRNSPNQGSASPRTPSPAGRQQSPLRPWHAPTVRTPSRPPWAPVHTLRQHSPSVHPLQTEHLGCQECLLCSPPTPVSPRMAGHLVSTSSVKAGNRNRGAGGQLINTSIGPRTAGAKNPSALGPVTHMQDQRAPGHSVHRLVEQGCGERATSGEGRPRPLPALPCCKEQAKGSSPNLHIPWEGPPPRWRGQTQSTFAR